MLILLDRMIAWLRGRSMLLLACIPDLPKALSIWTDDSNR
jgi:hypothetical protein